jgi:DnaJ-class molecular chaperone
MTEKQIKCPKCMGTGVIESISRWRALPEQKCTLCDGSGVTGPATDPSTEEEQEDWEKYQNWQKKDEKERIDE